MAVETGVMGDGSPHVRFLYTLYILPIIKKKKYFFYDN